MKTLDFIKQFGDGERHALIAESADWDKITPALVEFGDTTRINGGVAMILRVVVECIYVMGYNRGRREAARENLLVFTVAQEVTEWRS